MKKPSLALTLLALVAVACASWLLRPSPGTAMPQPNGYDDFVKAGQLLAGPIQRWDDLTLDELKELVTTNSASLTLVRQGLTKHSRLPAYRLVATTKNHINELSSHRQLAQVLAAESRLALEAGRTNDAALACMDCIRLGQECSRGGPLIDCMSGIGIQRFGLEKLQKLATGVDSMTARKVVQSLEECLRNIEPAAEVLRNERRWAWSGRYGISVPVQYLLNFGNSANSVSSLNSQITQATAWMQRVMVSFAVRAYELEKGQPPCSARDLATDYLKVVPRDVTTGHELELSP